MLDFLTLVPPDRPNNYLLCTAEYCPAAPSDAISPLFPVPPAVVKAAWDKMIVTQPRVTLRMADTTGTKVEYVQRSRFLRFSDKITVQFVAENEGSATSVLVFSQSKIGYWDMGVNRRRVKHWLNLLEMELSRHDAQQMPHG